MGAELAMLTPTHHGMPLSVQQWAGGLEAVLLSGGGGSGASPPAVGPMLSVMDLSLYPPLMVAPLQCTPGGDAQTVSAPASVVSLSDLSAELQLPPAYQASEAGVAEITRLTEARRVGMAQIGVPPPCLTLHPCLLRLGSMPITWRTCRGRCLTAW